MTARLLLFAVVILIAQPVLPAGDRLDQARAAVKAQRLDRAEQLLRQHLRSRRADLDARFLLARVLAWQGRYSAALIEYDALLRANPRDGDYLLGKAHTLVWDGKPAQALPLLKQARRIAPRYEDVWRLQITALIALGDEYRLAQARSIRDMAAVRFPRSEWRFDALEPGPAAARAVKPSQPKSTAVARQASPAAGTGETSGRADDSAPPATPGAQGPGVATGTVAGEESRTLVPAKVAGAGRQRSEVELGLSSETLSNGSADWHSVYLEGFHRFGERHAVYGMLRETRRFGLNDTEIQGGLSYPLGAAWILVLDASLSPTHNVLANYSALGLVQRAFAHGWDLQAGLRHNQYNEFTTVTAVLTAERYWSSFRGAYSLYLARPDGGSTVPNHVAQFDYYYGDRNSIGVIIANGREIADLNLGGALITDVRSIVLRGRHWIGPDWAVSFEVLHHEQGSLYTRQGARVGLRHVF